MTPKPVKKKPVKKVAKKAAMARTPFEEADEASQGSFVIVYGPPGIGKTSLCAHSPSPAFLITDDDTGIIKLKQMGAVPSDIFVMKPVPASYSNEEIPSGTGSEGWEYAIEMVEMFAEEDHPYKTLVLDSGSGLQTHSFQHCASMLFGGDINSDANDGFMSFYKGYTKSAEAYWKGELLRAVNKVKAAGRNVILICHSDTKEFRNPAGADFMKVIPDLYKHNWKFTAKMAEAIIYLGHSPDTETDKKKQTKATDAGRFIGVVDEGWFEAKNWHNHQDRIEFGETPEESWANLNQVLQLN